MRRVCDSNFERYFKEINIFLQSQARWLIAFSVYSECWYAASSLVGMARQRLRVDLDQHNSYLHAHISCEDVLTI